MAAGAALVRGVLREALARRQPRIDGRRPARRCRAAAAAAACRTACARTNLPRSTGDVWSALACSARNDPCVSRPAARVGIEVDALEAGAARRGQVVERRQVRVDERDRRGQQRRQVRRSLPGVGEEQARLLGERAPASRPSRSGRGCGPCRASGGCRAPTTACATCTNSSAARGPASRRSVSASRPSSVSSAPAPAAASSASSGPAPVSRNDSRVASAYGSSGSVVAGAAGRRLGAVEELRRLQHRRDDARDAVGRAGLGGVGVDLLHRLQLVGRPAAAARRAGRSRR